MAVELEKIVADADRDITVICGFPASGKSTAARYLAELVAAPIFDKDTFAPGLEEAVMDELVGDPHDRDSEGPPPRPARRRQTDRLGSL